VIHDLALGLEHWHEFFILAGTAGATLLGLLFVSVSLKTDVIMRSSEKHLRAQAMSAFESYLFVLVLSLFMLVPVARPRFIGMMLLALGVVGAARSVGHVVTAGRGATSTGLRLLRRRLILPVLAHGIIIWTGYEQFSGVSDPGFNPLVAILWLLITATRSAWDLMVEVGEVK
jgi:hypothetical protein